MSPGNPFILGHMVNGQGHEAQKAVPVWVFALLWLPASSSKVTRIGGFNDGPLTN